MRLCGIKTMGRRKANIIVLVCFHLLALALYYFFMPEFVSKWFLMKIDLLLWLVYCCGFGLAKYSKDDF